MTDSIYQYVLDQLENAKGSWPAVAEATGMSRRTIEKIARQEVKDPGVSHIEKLAGYFREQSKRPARTQHA
jgi:transcriptional regulator with XRE-family HTH domain